MFERCFKKIENNFERQIEYNQVNKILKDK